MKIEKKHIHKEVIMLILSIITITIISLLLCFAVLYGIMSISLDNQKSNYDTPAIPDLYSIII